MKNGGEGGARTHIAEGARFTVWGANQLLNLPPISQALECKECPENEQQSRGEFFYAGIEKWRHFLGKVRQAQPVYFNKLAKFQYRDYSASPRQLRSPARRASVGSRKASATACSTRSRS